MDNLASINALYNEAKDELEGSKADQAELTELREMKSDIERKEKQQAGIIENQVGVSCLLRQWCKGEKGVGWGKHRVVGKAVGSIGQMSLAWQTVGAGISRAMSVIKGDRQGV